VRSARQARTALLLLPRVLQVLQLLQRALLLLPPGGRTALRLVLLQGLPLVPVERPRRPQPQAPTALLLHPLRSRARPRGPRPQLSQRVLSNP
jgi:hypothetical protein